MPWFEIDYTVKGKLIISAASMGEAKHDIEHYDELSEFDQLNVNFTVNVDMIKSVEVDENGDPIEDNEDEE